MHLIIGQSQLDREMQNHITIMMEKVPRKTRIRKVYHLEEACHCRLSHKVQSWKTRGKQHQEGWFGSTGCSNSFHHRRQTWIRRKKHIRFSTRAAEI